jgi:Prealbumin-like fold domain
MTHYTSRWLRMAVAVAITSSFLMTAQVRPGSANTATCTTPTGVSLAGSSFEGGDGNMAVTTTGCTDWRTPPPNFAQATDLTNSGNDNIFGTGAKEDAISPSVVFQKGDNKNDLSRMYLGSEVGTNNHVVLYLAWERTAYNGAANEDFEINQSSNVANGLTLPLPRMDGDVLIQYNFGGSGTPVLDLWRWAGSTSSAFNVGGCLASQDVAPCWSNQTMLSAGQAVGLVNASTFTDPYSNQSVGVGGFGEAAVDLTAAGVFGSACETFGSAWVKGRTSTSPSAELKDFIAPTKVDISNCGEIKIIKHTDPRGIDKNFSFASNITNTTSFTLNDAGNMTGGDNAGNTEDITNVASGPYTVTELAEPTGFKLVSLTCTSGGRQDSTGSPQADITVTAGSVTTCTYVNQQQLGAIKITKTSSNAAATPLSLAHFEICTNAGPYTAQNPCSAATGGSDLITGSDGTKCLDNLEYGDYYVQETAAPSGYGIDDPNAEKRTVSTNATCSNTTYVGQSISFTDTPLTDLLVKAHAEVPGTTMTTITCAAGTTSTGTGIGNSPQGPSDPAELDANGLKTGTYTCTVVVAKT